MRVVLNTGVIQDLTSNQIRTLDSRIRTRVPALTGWSYSPLTGELVLDWGDIDDNTIRTKARNAWNNLKTDYPKIALRLLIFLEMIKEWEE